MDLTEAREEDKKVKKAITVAKQQIRTHGECNVIKEQKEQIGAHHAAGQSYKAQMKNC